MKRFVALLLISATLIGMVSCLTGCNGAKNDITKGELLNMLCDSFGMYSYSSKEPHTDTVKEDDKYFPSVQAAYEWEIINDKKISTEDKVDKDFLSSVLVKSVGFADANKMSTEELTQYAVDNKYVDFSYRGRTDGMRYVTYDEAANSVNQSVKMWSEKKFSAPFEEIRYGENTHKFNELSDSVVNNVDGTITIPSNMANNVKAGDTYVTNDPMTNSPKLYKVKNITTVGNNVIITPDEEQPELETSIQELDASGSVTPNLTDCMITDGLGNVIGSNTPATTQSNNSPQLPVATPLVYSSSDAQAETLANAKFALNFEIDGIKISGTVSSDKISFKAKGDIYTNKSKTVKVSVDKSYDIKDISFDYDYDIEWFKLKYAYAKLNYTTVDTTKVGIKYENNLVDKEWQIKEFTNEKLAKSIHSRLSDLQGKAGKTIKICEVPVYTNGVVSFNIVVRLKISISGEVQLVVTTSNAKGVEYKNGNIRYIKDEKKDTDIKVSAKAELTLYIGATFKALGINIVGLGMEGGVGAKGSVIIHVIDQERHLLADVKTEVELNVTEDETSTLRGLNISSESGKSITLNTEICFEYKVYGILKFTLDSESVIGKIFKGSEIEIFGEKNAAFLSGHIEDGIDVKKCTREFTIEDGKKDAIKEDNQSNNDSNVQEENDSILSSEYLDIDTYFVNLSIGENYTIKIKKIPVGYTQSDVVFESSDNNIIIVDSNGRISSVNSGSATVQVQTRDGKYKQECSVFVISLEPEQSFTPLSFVTHSFEGVRI